MSEIQTRFATTPHRTWLFGGFSQMAVALSLAGCTSLYLDGSFVTGKPHPEDFDGCWTMAGVDPTLLDPILLQFDNKRAAQKKKYFGEMFIAEMEEGGSGLSFLEFFQIEKYSGLSKGILRIPLPHPTKAAP